VETLLIVVLVAAVFGVYKAWLFFRGDTVGVARGLQQGEHALPGAPARAVVKRHLSPGQSRVELQFWVMGFATTFELTPREAQRLARVLEDGVAEIRKADE
jgi:L-aminopeptidase/D-esterase-like protein